jgi:hypothetical protein
VHQNDVHGDSIQPRGEPGLALEVADAPVDLQEDLLHQIFHVGALRAHASGEPRDLLAVLLEELAEGEAVAFLASRNEVRRV